MDTHSSSKKYALITGASAGLGRAMAKECANRGFDLILVSLPQEDLLQFGQTLKAQFGVEVHCYEADLTKLLEVQRLARWVKERYPLHILINNAGVGSAMSMEQATPAYIDNILQLNIRALSMLTYHFIPDLKKHRRAHILNVASLAAFGPIPFKTVYPASKAFVNAFSFCLRVELADSPIRVTVLNPGAMVTNPDVIARNRRQGWLARQLTLTPEYAAKHAIRGMLRGKRTVVPGLMCKLSYWLMRLAPTRLLSFVLAQIFKREVPPQWQEARLAIELEPLTVLADSPANSRKTPQ